MAETVRLQQVNHTQYERERILDEGLRLDRAGKLGGFTSGFALAQRVLAKERRRPTPASITNIDWFVEAIKAARDALEAPQSVDPKAPATTIAPTKPSAPQGGPDADNGGKRVRWHSDEQEALCMEAARLITDMKAGGPREALLLAQKNVLAPHRHRKIYSMTGVSSWYPEGLRAAMTKQRSEPKMAAAVAELAKINEDIAAQTPEPTPPVQHGLPRPEVETERGNTLPQQIAAAVPADLVMRSAGEDLASHLSGLWRGVRERLVQEVSNIFVEGIHRGIHRITLAQPEAEVTTAAVPTPETLRTAFPGVPVPPKRNQSVLVVGLKGDQPDHIRAEFAEKLDLRFCSSDQSKDQLRAMTSAADVTVVVTDFISHSHEDIIKARSKRFIKSAGGITRLKQELARLDGANLNGQAHA